MKYIELVKGLFTADHEARAKQEEPYVAYSIEDNRLMFSIVHEETTINYFYIESLEDNNVITLDSSTWVGYGDNKSKLEYSNDTTFWTSMDSVDYITINDGERLYMRCIEGNICKNLVLDGSMSEEELLSIGFTPLLITSTNCNIGGNINTVMFDYTYNIEDCVLSADAFAGLFIGVNVVDASKLELPATTLADYCYEYMFAGCISLVTPPELPATALAEACYRSMFWNCTSLVTAMELPATTLTVECYYGMFEDCTSLTTSPELPAIMLDERCYVGMFQGCTNLNHIKCLATDISAENCTGVWCLYISSTGTFVKHPNMNDWPTGEHGIPSGWTAVDAEL